MKSGMAARIWWIFGGLALAGLWLAVWLDAPWLPRAGFALLLAPFAAALAMTLPNTTHDRTSSVCAVGLFVLFCLAWLL